MAHDIQEVAGAPVKHMALSLQTEYILHAPRYCCSILPLHTYVGVVDGKKNMRGCCVSQEEIRLLLCRNAKWLQAAQFTLEAWVILVLRSGSRKTEHILTVQQHMVWLRVGLRGIIRNALCILGYRITLQFELLLSYGGRDVRHQHTAVCVADHDEF